MMTPMNPRRHTRTGPLTTWIRVLLVFSLTVAVLSSLPAGAVPPDPGGNANDRDTAASAPVGAAPESVEGDENTDAEQAADTTTRRSPITGPLIGGGKYTVAPDEYHRGELVVIGGSLDMLGEQHGEIVLIGAHARIAGPVHGEVVAVASKVSLEDGARLEEGLVNVLGSLDEADGVEIRKQRVDLPLIDLSYFATGKSIFWVLLWLVFWIKLVTTAFLFLAIIVVAALVPGRIELAAEVFPAHWGRSFLFGLLACVGAALCIVLLAVSIIGIPLAMILGIAMKVIKWIGLAAIFLATGRQLLRSMTARTPSYFPGVLLGFFLFAIVNFIPIFGGILMLLLSITGIGLMVVTRLGTRVPGEPGKTAARTGGGKAPPPGGSGPGVSPPTAAEPASPPEVPPEGLGPAR